MEACRKKIHVIPMILMAAVLLFSFSSCRNNNHPESREEILWSQYRLIIDMLYQGGDPWHSGSLFKQITLIEETDVDGNPYYRGELSESLEESLESLVEIYNANSTTAIHVVTNEVRYGLTEGIVEAAAKENRDAPLIFFIRWLGEPADLVYAVDVPDRGVVAGTDVLDITCNFRYYSHPEYFPFYILRDQFFVT